MPYRNLTFAGLALPIVDATYPIGTPPSQSQALGAFDGSGTYRAPPAYPWQFRYAGLAYADSAAAFLTTVNALKALQGQRGILTRTSDDSSLVQWCNARLMEVPGERGVVHMLHQPLEFTFEILEPWRGTARSITTTLTTWPTVIPLTHAGDTPVTDVQITLHAVADVTYFRLDYTIGTAGNTSLEFTDTVLAGTDLVLECGGPTIRNDGADAYANLSYLAGHTLRGWLQLDSGTHDITAYALSGTDPTLKFAYDDAWL